MADVGLMRSHNHAEMVGKVAKTMQVYVDLCLCFHASCLFMMSVSG